MEKDHIIFRSTKNYVAIYVSIELTCRLNRKFHEMFLRNFFFNDSNMSARNNANFLRGGIAPLSRHS